MSNEKELDTLFQMSNDKELDTLFQMRNIQTQSGQLT